MNEVKSPKKPLVYYYAIVILVILALNFLAVLSRRNCGSMTQRCFAVTEMRSKRICLGGFGRGWEAEKRRLLQ